MRKSRNKNKPHQGCSGRRPQGTADITTTSKMRTTFNLKYAWIRELRDDKRVNIEHVNADVNPPDLLTKIHSNSRSNKLIKIINPIRINQIQVQKIQDQSEEEEDPKEGIGENEIRNKDDVEDTDYDICLAWVCGNGSCEVDSNFEKKDTE